MKFTRLVSLALTALPFFVQGASAADSWAGANNYYVYTLPTQEQESLFSAMKDAGMKVLRTWVTGLGSGQKNSDNGSVGDLEHDGLGKYDDTVLDKIDETMILANKYGIKLLIGMHDVNALKGGDEYGKAAGGWEKFYTDQTTIKAFNSRIDHILNGHKNSQAGNKPWSQLGDYIFGFEPQNEPMIFDQNLYKNNLDWICNAAKQIRSNVDDKNMLIFTGGGSGSASVQDYFFSDQCPGIDVVAIHDYNDDWNNFMSNAVKQAQSAGKKLIVEEWGSSYSGDDSKRTSNMQDNVKNINNYGVPWLYWELITNTDPHQSEDYEIDVNGQDWDTIEDLAQDTAKVSSPFDFSGSL